MQTDNYHRMRRLSALIWQRPERLLPATRPFRSPSSRHRALLQQAQASHCQALRALRATRAPN